MKIEVNSQTAYAYTGARELASEQPTIVFIHGGGLDHSVWLLQSRYFAHHGKNVLAVDLPGHGRSGGDALPNIGAMADWISALLDALSIEQATVVGHSMGSLVALETAANHPSRVEKLVLIGTAVPMAVSDPLLDAAKANHHDAFDMVNLWGHSGLAQIGGNQAPGMWMTGGGVRLLERSRPGVLHNDLKACHEYRHGLDSGARVQCPTLMLLGQLDMMTPVKVARDLQNAIVDARAVVLERCGHMLMAEKPNQVLDNLVQFI